MLTLRQRHVVAVASQRPALARHARPARPTYLGHQGKLLGRSVRCQATEEAVAEESGEKVNGTGPKDTAILNAPGASYAPDGSVQSTMGVPDDDVLQIKNLRAVLEERPSPFKQSGGRFVGDRDLVRISAIGFESDDSAGASTCDSAGAVFDEEQGICIPLPPFAIRGGPRRSIYYDPKQVTAAVVTCGGLCPGLNDVVQNIVYTLIEYGVPDDQIYGIRYGLRGFYDRSSKPILLSPAVVDGIHLKGGTILGTSRGGADLKQIANRVRLWGVNQLYVVGGNGGNAAANAIQQECEKQGINVGVVGVPKSIDNDILLIDKCFGFETSFTEAQNALMAAKVEARSNLNGVGLVKLMGRQSGFIAVQASMASGVVDACLIPEVPFTVEKLTNYVAKKVEEKGHAVICVAEGAGQDLLGGSEGATDQSGNPILKDIGLFIKDELKQRLKVDVKYIDPSYMVRAMPTNAADRIYCKVLGQNAVHANFAGYTGVTVGQINMHQVLLPIPTIIQAARTIDPKGRDWDRLLAAIQQPDLSAD